MSVWLTRYDMFESNRHQVDTTDDSRILVTGGMDGVVKIWNSGKRKGSE